MRLKPFKSDLKYKGKKNKKELVDKVTIQKTPGRNSGASSTRKSRREAKIKDNRREEDSVEIKKSELTNILTMTIRDPSKATEGLCKQLRKVLMPNSFTKLETNLKMQDVIDVCDQLFVTEIIYISKDELKIAVLPNGPTYIFTIVSYDPSYKNFPMELYKEPAFITMEGKCAYKSIFECFGVKEGDFKRALHIHFKGDLIYLRHFCTSTEDLEDKFKVCLREIGPRLELKLKRIDDGVFPEMKLKKTRYYIKKREEK